MAIVDALLKIDDTDGNLKKITATEENYLAYRAGLQLAAAGTSEVASLNSSSGTTVGTYTDTQFDQAVGTHPGSSLTTTTTNTTIYQTTGTAPENIANFVKPVLWDQDPGDIEALNDTQLSTAVDRLIATIFTNDYPGSYQLGSSAPSGDYTAHLSNIFTDNRTDGTTVNYSVYKRQTMTEPTVVKTVKLEGTNADLKGMSNTEIQVTFGQRAKTRIMSTGIGTYQLRSSAAGVPTDPGTWVAKGTATDTKQQTADADYTRDSTRVSTRDSTQNFTRISTTDYISNYVNDYIGNYVNENTNYDAAAFTEDYIGNYDGTLGPEFVGNYDGATFEGNYAAAYALDVNYVATYGGFAAYSGPVYQGGGAYSSGPGAFAGTYLSDADTFTTSVATYEGNYSDGRGSNLFINLFEGIYTGAPFDGASYSGIVYYLTNYAGDYEATYEGNYLSTFDGNYLGDYVPTYIGDADYEGNYEAGYQNEYTGDYTGDYIGNFIGDYTGNYIGNYLGETIQGTSETIETYTLYVRTA
jgi:hypothetical protein